MTKFKTALHSKALLRLIQSAFILTCAIALGTSKTQPLPEAPTDAQLFQAQIFEHALVPTRTTLLEQNKLLSRALNAFLNQTNSNDTTVLTDFLTEHSDSPWKSGLLLNLGEIWRRQGFFSRALEAWEESWKTAKTAKSSSAKAMADRVVAELAQMNAWVGRFDRLEILFKDIEGREISGGASERLTSAKYGLALMKSDPGESFKCGPYALQQIRLFRNRSADFSGVRAAKSTTNGFTLSQLKELSRQWGMEFQIGKRHPGAEVPLPAVAHWKLNHFGALLKKRDGAYLLQDSTLNRLYGQEMWISEKALDEESSGYFLIPKGPLPNGWEAGTDGAETVFGKGTTCCQNPDALTPDDEKSCPTPEGGDPFGMPRYSVHLMLVSLNIVDIPVGYKPALGPAMSFTTRYNQRDIYSEAAPNYSNLGSKWTFDWSTYIEDNGESSAAPSTLYRHVGGGGRMASVATSSTSVLPVSYAADLDGNVVIRTSANVYELTSPDGSQQIFSKPSGIAGARKLWLKNIKDPFGKSITFYYEDDDDPTDPEGAVTTPVAGRLRSVVDSVGLRMRFRYDLAGDPYKITSVEDPFGRQAFFEYNPSGYLKKITDVIGMSSIFSYEQGSDFINQLVTPYGTTRFARGEVVGATPIRWLDITDANGDTERFLFRHGANIPNESEYPPGPWMIDYMGYRNTFHFSKKAFHDFPQELLNDPSTTAYLDNWPKATVYHWLHDELLDPDPLKKHTSALLESIKRPLESRIWFSYPGQVTPSMMLGVTLRKPSIVARMVGDGAASASQVQKFEYNSNGKVTKYTDPNGRVTEYEYYPNGIDLYRVRQRGVNNAINDLLVEFGTYTIPHRPSSITDASRRTSSLSWNSDGTPDAFTNPKSETIRFAYYPSTSGTAAGQRGRLASVSKDSTAWLKTFDYDDKGRVSSVTDSEDYTINVERDLLDRPTRITYPDQSFDEYTYERLDLVRVVDRLGHRSSMTYDNLARLLTKRDGLGKLTQYSWCGCNGLESITDPLGHTTSWVRDVQGRPIEKWYADSTTSTKVALQYESRTSRLRSLTDAKGQIKTYSYSADDALQQIAYANASVATPTVSFTYQTQYPRIETMTDGTGQTTYSYNSVPGTQTLGAGRLATVDGPLANDTIQYGYDELGRSTSQSINGTGQSITFDSLGRTASHVTPLGTFTPAYVNATGRPASLTFPNDQKTSFGYFGNLGDQLLCQVVNEKVNQGTPSPVSGFYYAYNKNGTISVMQTTVDSSARTTFAYDYDLNDQLTGVQQTEASPPNVEGGISKAWAYGYDDMGNRTSTQVETSAGNPTVTAATYNSVNQLTAQSGTGTLPVRFTVELTEPAVVTVNGQEATEISDFNGAPWRRFTTSLGLSPGNQSVSVVAKDYGGTSGNTATKNYTVTVAGGAAKSFQYDLNGNCTVSGTASYEWDAEDRLTAIVQGSARTEFSYDGLSRRAKIIEKNNGSITSTKQFVWCGSQICEERDGNNTITKRYFREGFQVGTANYFYTRDHLGSIREVLDASQNVVARYDYDSFGKRSANLITSSSINADFGFTGHYFHQPSGIHLALYRAYDAELARWLSRDPIGERAGLNLFGYVSNEPVNLIDPLGLRDENRVPILPTDPSTGKSARYGHPDPNSAHRCELGQKDDPWLLEFVHEHGFVGAEGMVGSPVGVTAGLSHDGKGETEGFAGVGLSEGLDITIGGGLKAEVGNPGGWGVNISGGVGAGPGISGTISFTEHGVGGQILIGIGAGLGGSVTAGFSGKIK